eukprot:gene56267-62960_t
MAPLRWVAAAAAPPAAARQSHRIVVTLTQGRGEEHAMIVDRKRVAAVHLCCLSARLRPARWPDDLRIL